MIPLIIDNKTTNYMISDTGEIFNKKTKKYLKGTIRNGYRMVKLTIDNKKKDYSVHRLVALSFLENPKNLSQVNHKDRNKLNNTVENLEWVSNSENMQHMHKTGKKKRQKILTIQEPIDETHGWKQYKDTNYWFNKDGQGVNIKTNKYLNTSINNSGYSRYYLYINSQRFALLAHRIIYELFSGEKLTKTDQINHKDGNKQNNTYENLEKVNNKENMYHSFYILKKNIKPVLQYDLNNNLIKEYPSISVAARSLNICDSGIVQACKGIINTYYGFIWKYKEV